MFLLRDPYFWALISVMGLFGFTVSIRSRKLTTYPIFSLICGFVFLIGIILLATPICEGPRFNIGWGHWVAGGIFLSVAAVLILPNYKTLFAPYNAEKLYITRGWYSIIRNPVYLGILAFTAGWSILFGSVLGLILFPFWWAGFMLLIIVEEEYFEASMGLAYLQYKHRVPGRFLPRWHSNRKAATNPYPFKNLVFKGGGVRGIAYTGVLEVLDTYKILPQIERVAGTSAGAITATLISFRLNFTETMRLIDSLDYTRVPHKVDAEDIEINKMVNLFSRLGERFGDINCIMRLIRRYGWYSSDYFANWMEDVIASQCNGNRRATFADFQAAGFRDLYIMATNLTTRSAITFSARHTPQVAVVDAVRMSMSIPLYFEALRFDGRNLGQGDTFVDGGVFDNFPIQIFDEPRYAQNNSWYLGGVNWETLGCYLYPDEETLHKPRPTNDIREFISLVTESVWDAYQTSAFDQNQIVQRRSIKISDCGIAPTDFNIHPGDPKYQQLVQSARKSTREFLENYQTYRIDW